VSSCTLALFLSNLNRQFRLLFPGEDRERASRGRNPAVRHALGPKESVWALYCRALLLWNSCFARLRASSRAYSTGPLGDREAEFAVEAFNECRALEEGRRAHTCNSDAEMLYNAGEYIQLYVWLGFLEAVR
jgi:hypothetical protein